MKTEEFMAIHTNNTENEDIMGKYMYFSLPRLILKTERVNEICAQIGFPLTAKESITPTDAFKSATGEIHDKIEDDTLNGKVVYKIYCRDNMRVENDRISRELVEERLGKNSNRYKKLANIVLDKNTGMLMLEDVIDYSERDIQKYFDEAEMRYSLYLQCIGNRTIETMAQKYIASLHGIAISAKGYHYFVPKEHMHGVNLLEDFMELIAKENLFTYADRRDSKYISINSMYVADDEKQRSKMAHEFYIDMGKEIDEYQRRITRILQNGSVSQRVLDRWDLKIQALQNKKREYETVLKQRLNGIDEDFTMLKDMRDQLNYSIKQSQLFGIAA